MRFPSVSPHLLLALSAVFWAGHHVVTRGMREEFTPATLSFWRWLVVILVLGLIAGRGAYRKRMLLRGQWLRILLFGISGTGVYNIFTYAGIQLTTATNALLIHSLTPALIPLLAWLFFRERIKLKTAVGIAVSFAGVLAIVTRLDSSALAQLGVNAGDLWILGSAVLWALYTVCLRWRPPQFTQMEFLFVISLAGLVPIAPLFLLEISGGGASAYPTPEIALVVIYLAVILSILNYTMWSIGVQALGSTPAGIYMNLVPLLGILMAILFLSERPRPYHAVGFVLVLAGVWLASNRKGV